MEIVIYALIIVLVLVVSNKVDRLKKATDIDRDMLIILLKEKVRRDAERISKKVELLKEELENRNKQNNVKKTRTNSKTK
jgi:hypothetical protein